MKTQDAVRYFGSQAKLAKALGINSSAVTQWGEEIPQRRQYEIERLTGGRLKAGIAIDTTGGTPGTQQGETMSVHNHNLEDLDADAAKQEMVRQSELVAQLVLLIEEMEYIGNKAAELSLRVQYHHAQADLLQSMMYLVGTSDARTESLRQRHIERGVAYQHELDRLGNTEQ